MTKLGFFVGGILLIPLMYFSIIKKKYGNSNKDVINTNILSSHLPFFFIITLVTGHVAVQ